MKIMLATVLLLLPGDGDPGEEGVKLYRQGKYAEAVEAFRAGLKDDPDNPRLHYNVALALWRLGAADPAEEAAEKAAALSDGAFDGLRDGILGNLRFDKARQMASAEMKPQEEIESLDKAIETVGVARTHFQRGALALERRRAGAGAELLRNLERAMKLEDELIKRRDDAKKKQDEQKDKDKDKDKDNKDKKDKKDDKSDKGKQEKDPKAQPEPDPKKPEDKPKDQPKDDGKQEKKPQQAQPPQAAPGEHDPTKELTPEQKRALLERLKQFEADLKKLKAARKGKRPKVKGDW